MPNDVKPWVVLIIRQDGSMNASSSQGSGGSEGRRNEMFDVHSVVGMFQLWNRKLENTLAGRDQR